MDADRRRVTRRRSVLAGISLVLACSTILVATIAVWAHQVAFNTERFTAVASSALEQPEVIDPLAARISAQVVTTLDVQSRLANVLPDRVTAIAGPVTLALQDGLTRRLQTLLAEPRMQQALTKALSFAHTRVMNLLRDQADARPAVQQVLHGARSLVGDAEDQLRQRRGQVRSDRREQLVVRQTRDAAGVLEHQRRLGAEATHQARRCLHPGELRARDRAEQG